MTTHYETLGVAAVDTTEEIKKRYYALAREHHPDKGGDPALMAAVGEAWAVLRDPKRRAHYDATLRLLGTPCAPCSGKGRRYRTKGLTGRTSVLCAGCNGAGVVVTMSIPTGRRSRK